MASGVGVAVAVGLACPAVGVGVDAANNTMLHTGRMLINLKKSHDKQERLIERLLERAAQVNGAKLYLQPTQDLTIDAETGPTEYRLSLEGVDTQAVNDWARKLVEKLRTADLSASVRNPTTDAGAQGLAAYVDIDRATASRLSVTASSVDCPSDTVAWRVSGAKP